MTIPPIKSDKILVAYFSWSGNTRKIAIQIKQLLACDIFEIEAAKEYSAVYREVVSKARDELRSGEKPELKNKLASIDQYDKIFIGYPNWCNTFPAPVSSFLSEYNFAGKTIIPFCTHGGGGAGQSFADVSKQCPNAEILKGFSINGYSARENNTELKEWLNLLTKDQR